MNRNQQGDNNTQWKGDSVSYFGLHRYVERYVPKPDVCPSCQIHSKLEIHNISGNYTRDLSDWEWLCVKCHMEKDGRLSKLIERNKSPERKLFKNPITGRFERRDHDRNRI